MYSNIATVVPLAANVPPMVVAFLANQVKAGFPSPAEDLGAERLDLASLLVPNPQATFFMRASGVSMLNCGINDQDILVVNKSKRPRHGQIVIAVVDGEFTVKELYQRAGRMKLKSANPTYPDITPREGQTIEVWGVVTACIKQFAS